MAVAITEEFGGTEVPRQWNWHRSAPRRVVKKYQTSGPLAGWKAWKKHLLRRKRPDVSPLLSGRRPPLLWGWPDGQQTGMHLPSLKSPFELAQRMLDAKGLPQAGDLQALEMLAVCYQLRDLAQEASAKSWWDVVERLHDVSAEAQHPRIALSADPVDILEQQLLAGELPLALSFSFPEINGLRPLRNTARTFLSDALLELTDGEGLPHTRLLPVLGPLFACWTRVRWLGRRWKRGPWSRKAEVQYQWLVQHAMRLADDGGRFVLTRHDDAPTEWNCAMFSMALELSGDDRDCAAAKVAIGGRAVPRRMKPRSNRLPDSSLNSDWSGLAIMADSWCRSSVRLAIAYAEDPVRLELASGGQRWLAGPWSFETICDGKPAHPIGEWENLFWTSDKTCDMLELGIKLSNGLRLERQLLLGRKDRVLYLADVLISDCGTPRQLKHSFYLPLDCQVHWQPEAETRDGLLLNDRLRAAVLPLALPEWRADPRGGNLVEKDGRLLLTQEASGRALYCPLLIDLKPRRAKKERTWRRLTVAEWMEIVPQDIAAGFRAQSGRDQWLFYRSLGPAGNRTVLGQNIAGEFCAGRIRSTGRLHDWIEIEAV
jgi:hypothetical protein